MSNTQINITLIRQGATKLQETVWEESRKTLADSGTPESFPAHAYGALEAFMGIMLEDIARAHPEAAPTIQTLLADRIGTVRPK